MNENTALTTFTFQGHTLQVISHHGEPWFIVNEVCEALGIANPKDAFSRLSDHQKSGVGNADPHGRIQQTNITSEGGVYKLAFRSRKKEAEEFTDLVVDKILPAIRKTGSYNPSGQLEGNALERITQLERTVSSLVKQVPSPRKQQAETDTVDRRILAALILGERSLVYSEWQRECKQTLKISHATFNRYRKYLTEQGYVSKYRPEGQFVIHYCTPPLAREMKEGSHPFEYRDATY